MLENVKERSARFEHALLVIVAMKPEGEQITEADYERAATVARMVERFESEQAAARVRLPSPAVVTSGAPGAPAPRPKRAYRRRKPRAAPESAPKRGRPKSATPPAEG